MNYQKINNVICDICRKEGKGVGFTRKGYCATVVEYCRDCWESVVIPALKKKEGGRTMKTELELHQKLKILKMWLDADIRGEIYLSPTEEQMIENKIEILEWILEMDENESEHYDKNKSRI